MVLLSYVFLFVRFVSHFANCGEQFASDGEALHALKQLTQVDGLETNFARVTLLFYFLDAHG